MPTPCTFTAHWPVAAMPLIKAHDPAPSNSCAAVAKVSKNAVKTSAASTVVVSYWQVRMYLLSWGLTMVPESSETLSFMSALCRKFEVLFTTL